MISQSWENKLNPFFVFRLLQVRIRYTRGSHWQGDIAIDRINIEAGLC